MTPEQQRICIATACGWKCFPPTEPSDGNWLSPAPLGEFHESPPDYLNDLNAMHEAEKFLFSQGKQAAYVKALWEVNGAENNKWTDLAGLISAVPAQRAEAFLKAIGKWVAS